MESLRMQGKSVIVTGGAKGIGEGCVRACHRLGADVLVFDMDEVAMHALANELNSKGLGRVVVQKGDVRSESDVRLCMTLAVGNFLGIDALICNAGWHPPAVSIEDASVDDFESIMRLNLTSTFLFCKYATPLLKKIERGDCYCVQSYRRVWAVKRSAILRLKGRPTGTHEGAGRGSRALPSPRECGVPVECAHSADDVMGSVAARPSKGARRAFCTAVDWANGNHKRNRLNLCVSCVAGCRVHHRPGDRCGWRRQSQQVNPHDVLCGSLFAQITSHTCAHMHLQYTVAYTPRS
eukprot:Opistho-2@80908